STMVHLSLHCTEAHTLPISCLALHPRKFIVASSSDDQLWRLWGMSVGEMIMTGEGHSDVALWLQLSPKWWKPGHHQWRHNSKDLGFLPRPLHPDSGCERCRNTLCGHVDSVNSVTFLPFSNTLLTWSADKTLSLWEARIGVCAQTFYGQHHSCNHATLNALGDTVASYESYGVVKLWDVRKVAVMITMETGPHPSNQVAFHPSGRTLAIASNDGSFIVHSVIFDHKGEYLLSAGSDSRLVMKLINA
uniref:Uncharacterized protein n=1 Tax=Hucho hucho TaxID=62062 RepID=A0A4W5REW9_9TELE